MSPESSSQEFLPSSSALVVSEYFKDSRHLSIGDNGNFSTIHGDQHNAYYLNTITEARMVKKKMFIVATEEEEAEFEEFPQIKRGEFLAERNIYRRHEWIYDRARQKCVGCERTLIAGDVRRIGGVASKCMVMEYSGQGAGEVSMGRLNAVSSLTEKPSCGRRIFENLVELGGLGGMLVLDKVLKRSQTSRERATSGNQSVEYPDARTYWWYVLDISAWRLADDMADLVPVAHLKDRVGEMGQNYLGALEIQMGCCMDCSLWMDTSRGVFCRGPEGPYWGGAGGFGFEDFPLDTELVKEDVLIRYLGSTNQDRVVVYGLSWAWRAGGSQLEVDQPTVISTLTDTILAVGPSGVWTENWRSCLGKREELLDGTTRFTLEHNGRHPELEFSWSEAKCDWLAQAPSVFHAHGIPLEDNMSKYELVLPKRLAGTISESEVKRQRREECPTIYLFIPLPTSTFWSFDSDGQNPIAADLCHYLGLPISLSLECWEFSWPAMVDKTLQAYQIARGFDPNTTEFAQHNQYHIYEIANQPLSSRFEKIEDLEESKDSEEHEDSGKPTETPIHSVHLEEPADMFLSGEIQPKDLPANTTTQGHTLQKSARYTSNYPHSNSTTPFSASTDFPCAVLQDPKSASPSAKTSSRAHLGGEKSFDSLRLSFRLTARIHRFDTPTSTNCKQATSYPQVKTTLVVLD
ncbi:hypothetical protein V5O48_006173 [Marasmius crinis-equi]|uniref:Uncharacterized protein n=1 Tax=Marasmius crinis-equi TaxID=585013 RepID=A0ABR3FK66_9AGAR